MSSVFHVEMKKGILAMKSFAISVIGILKRTRTKLISSSKRFMKTLSRQWMELIMVFPTIRQRSNRNTCSNLNDQLYIADGGFQ